MSTRPFKHQKVNFEVNDNERSEEELREEKINNLQTIDSFIESENNVVDLYIISW